MKVEILDLDINLPDNSANEYANALLAELKKYHTHFDTHSMNDWELYLKGQKDMIALIINYIEITL